MKAPEWYALQRLLWHTKAHKMYTQHLAHTLFLHISPYSWCFFCHSRLADTGITCVPTRQYISSLTSSDLHTSYLVPLFLVKSQAQEMT